MICSQCGSNIAAGSAACPNCGAQQPGNVSQGAGAHNPAGASGAYNQPGPSGGYNPAGPSGTPEAPAPAFNFDAKRWSRDDQIVGVASLLLLISLFLPWYTVSFGPESASASGTTGHGYLWIVFVIALAIVAFLIVQAGFQTLPFNLPFSPARLLLGLTGINLLLVLIAFLFKPGTGDALVNVSVGWGFGAFLGLICAIAAVVPLALPLVRARTASR
jgi:hypothetical protein